MPAIDRSLSDCRYWWAITLLLTAELTNHIHPHSNGEIVFVIVLQLMGAIVFGFIIGTVGTILVSTHAHHFHRSVIELVDLGLGL